MKRNRDKTVRRYLHEVKSALSASGAFPSAFYDAFSGEVYGYAEEQRDVSFQSLVLKFGTPEEISKSFFYTGKRAPVLDANRKKILWRRCALLSFVLLTAALAAVVVTVRITSRTITVSDPIVVSVEPASDALSKQTLPASRGEATVLSKMDRNRVIMTADSRPASVAVSFANRFLESAPDAADSSSSSLTLHIDSAGSLSVSVRRFDRDNAASSSFAPLPVPDPSDGRLRVYSFDQGEKVTVETTRVDSSAQSPNASVIKAVREVTFQNADGEIEWKYLLSGVFYCRYGEYALCTESSFDVVYADGWTFSSARTDHSGAVAKGTGNFKKEFLSVLIHDIDIDVSLSLDVYGNLL